LAAISFEFFVGIGRYWVLVVNFFNISLINRNLWSLFSWTKTSRAEGSWGYQDGHFASDALAGYPLAKLCRHDLLVRQEDKTPLMLRSNWNTLIRHLVFS